MIRAALMRLVSRAHDELPQSSGAFGGSPWPAVGKGKRCPACGVPSYKVLYGGVPGLVCKTCNTVFGRCREIVENDVRTLGKPRFRFAVYEGSTLVALFRQWRRLA